MNKLDTSNSYNYKYETDTLAIHILGGLKINKLETLRVTLSIAKSVIPAKAGIPQGNILRQSIDLYNDNLVEKLVRKCAERLEIGTSVIRQDLQALTHELENYRFILLKSEQQGAAPKYKELTTIEKRAATAFLKKEGLLTLTNEYIGKSGVIGEVGNRLLMYLIFTSRKTNNPLHCISLGSSGVGKTHLQSKVSELIPEEDKIEITVLSANAFYYFNRTELQHKLILIEDLDGAESVLYPLRELQSKKRITKTVVHKDRKGNTKTIHLTVEGPVSVAGCTTQESIYEDNSNRSFLLYIDESEEQDKKIMNYQRRASAGKLNEQDELAAAELLRNAQRILKPIKVINPFAEYLSLPSAVFKPRRTNSHYLQFIEAITFYKQYQRAQQVNEETGELYIETEIEDIKEANELITEVLLRKSDMLSGSARTFFESLKTSLKKQTATNFSNSEVRRWLRLPKTTVRRRFLELLDADVIQRIPIKEKKIYRYELVQKDDYNTMKARIEKALQDCINEINRANEPHRTTAI